MKKSLFVLLFLSFQLPAYSQVGELVWEEQFDSVNTDVWNVIDSNGCPRLCGWGNSELEFYKPYNVYVDSITGEEGNSALVLEAQKQMWAGSPFTSGRIESENNLAIRYGVVEVRMAVPDLEVGLWPAFWMLGANHETDGWPKSGEIDIMEMGHKLAERNRQGHPNAPINNYVGANLIWYASAACGGNPTCAASIADDTGFNQPYEASDSLDNRFVTYRLYWDSNSIKFTVIDQEVEYDLYTAAVSISGGELASTFREPFFFITNLAVGGTFTDASNANEVTAPLPAKMYIDYIKVNKWNGQGELYLDGLLVSNEEVETTPNLVKLSQNYPNPFNPSTSINFELPSSGNVQLSVFDLQGRRVADLANKVYSQGSHSVQFDASGLSSGVYYYSLTFDGFSQFKKMTLIK
ncbi:MAG: family 16 glycosylhydrolase [Balneolaceae bacterium]